MVRDTWLNVDKQLRSEFKPLFVIGGENMPEVTRVKVKEENHMYKDLLILPVHEGFTEVRI